MSRSLTNVNDNFQRNDGGDPVARTPSVAEFSALDIGDRGFHPSAIVTAVRSAGLPARPGRSSARTVFRFLPGQFGNHESPPIGGVRTTAHQNQAGGMSWWVTASVAAHNAAQEKVDGVLQVAFLLLGSAVDPGIRQPRG